MSSVETTASVPSLLLPPSLLQSVPTVPAAGLKPEVLREQWRAMGKRRPEGWNVLCFYKETETPYGPFSNFYRSENFWLFTLPSFANRDQLEVSGRNTTIRVRFSEIAIMACKASMMGDFDMFDLIVESDCPMIAKGLGRKIRGFSDEMWNQQVCYVAFAVVQAKVEAD